MTLTADNKFKQLSEKIEKIFQDGTRVGADVVDYIDTTFSNLSPNELEEIINDESNCERDVLLELIFFPDEAIQLPLEPWLEKNTFTEAEVEKVRTDLLSKKIKTKILFTEERISIDLRVPQSVIEPFLIRLHIDRKIDPRILQSISQKVAEPDQIPVKVGIRNARRAPAGSQIDFLCRYFEKVRPDGNLIEGLEFILEFFSEIGDEADIYDALMAKKKNCFHQLKKVENFEKKLKKDTMETLILRGERVPYIDKSETLKTISMIDRISIIVFGRTDPISSTTESSESFTYQSPEDLKQMFRRLS